LGLISGAVPSASASPVVPSPAMLGASVLRLDGPWRFHLGDDPAWADPAFDDAAWELVDLRAPPGAHDADVGLSGYVAGWRLRHPGYRGFAWYRLRVVVAAPPGAPLAVAGPPLVDDAYQLFIDGQLAGSAGDFSHPLPAVSSIQPRAFALPARAGPNGLVDRSLAFRVWMGPGSWEDPVEPDGGGLHIAPALGLAAEIEKHCRLQWLETVEGYVVDAIEPALFLVLAAMSAALLPLAGLRTRPRYAWLAAALVSTALLRANQAFYFWTQLETATTFDFAKNVVLVPFVLGAWTMTWSNWFDSSEGRLRRAVAWVVALFVLCQLATRSWLFGAPPALDQALHLVSMCLRLSFALALGWIAVAAARAHGRAAWLPLLAMLLMAVGLFARELSALHVTGIWFPFGVGVSRTQFAYAALVWVLFVLLQRHLVALVKLQAAGPARPAGAP
jgi:hypothetical protein